MFTATSALCVTGLTVVDTGTHWSALGETVILGLIQVGGIGVMTLASLIVLLIGGRLGVRTSLLSEAEARGHRQMSARDVVVGVVRTSLIFEALVASALTARFMIGYGEPPLRALYDGVFHSISAFNNAGFGLRPDNMESWVTDPWVCLPVAAAVISGGLAFPVLWELRRRWATPGRWSLHTRITVTWSAILLVGGTLVVLVIEWAEPLSLGGLNAPSRVLAAFFHSTVARTAGFNTLPIGDLQPETLLTREGPDLHWRRQRRHRRRDQGDDLCPARLHHVG